MGQLIAGGWTEEQAEMLRRLVGEKMSYSQIALAINEKYGTTYTRNGTIGKGNRMNLESQWKPAPSAPTRVRATKTRSGEHHAIRKIVRSNGNSNSLRAIMVTSAKMERLRCIEIECKVPFADVVGCRYSDSEDMPFLFCDGPQKKGSSYCIAHWALCWEPGKPRASRAPFIGRAA